MAEAHPIPSCYHFNNLTGRTFDRWSVLDYAGSGKWRCRCRCGRAKVVVGHTLLSGRSRSCGCLSSEITARMNSIRGHHMSNTKTWRSWNAMIHRCTDPKDKDYPRWGGRGITVAPEWMEFPQFLADMGERPLGTTLDRMNNNGGYSKDNCRWATDLQQQNNRRSNVFITFRGNTLSISDWARRSGISRCVLWSRLRKHHWPVSKALTHPVRKITKSSRGPAASERTCDG